jgi:hypothetical protein
MASSGRPAEAPQSSLGQLADTANAVAESIGSIAGELGSEIRQRPYTALALTAGLAFAIGAVWKLSRQRPPSRWEALAQQMPDLGGRNGWARRWVSR